MDTTCSLIINPKNYVISTTSIDIHKLRLRTYIGFNPEELTKQQDVVISAKINYQSGNARKTDDELTALNYKTITKQIIQHVENSKFRLLEKLASDLVDIVMANELVTEAKVTVDKPHALRFSDSVGITHEASRLI